MSENAVFKCFKILVAAYPGTSIDDSTGKLYARLLADLPDDILEAAVLDHISRSIWFPKVAELRSACAELMHGTGRYAPDAYSAWAEVSQAIPQYGSWRRPPFSHPLIEQTVDAMGWRNLCLSTNQTSDRMRFVEAFDIYKSRQLDDAVTLPQIAALTERFRLPAGINKMLPESEATDSDYEGET